ncbi:MAG: VTT domain-containing protein [Woeseiaceae bacterium]
MRRTSPHHRLLQHLFIVGMIIMLIGVVAASESLHRYADAVIVWGEGVIAVQPYLGMAVFVALSMLSAMVAFFSSAVFVPLAIYTWGNGTTALLLWIGWLLGGIASFCIGRFLGRKVASAIVGEDKISAWQSQLERRSRFLEVLLFQAVVPSEIPGYVLGILRYRFSLYLLALAVTELPYVFGVVFLGESFLQGASPVILVLGITVVVVAVLLLTFRSRFKSTDQSS